MILEGIVTTLGPDGVLNVAPMGPRVGPEMDRLLLRPFRTSRTYQNLRHHGEGVFHVTDDVLLLARAAVGPVQTPETFAANHVRGRVLCDACRYFEFRIRHWDESGERVGLDADVVAVGRLRDFFGFNRAKHAIVEAAILATRIHLLPAEEIETEYRRLAVLVDKTGGEQEQTAMTFLRDYVSRKRAGGDS